MLRAIIFDWDCTLCDSAEAGYNAYLTVFKELGIPPITLEEFKDRIDSNYWEFQQASVIHPSKRGLVPDLWDTAYEKYQQKHHIRLFSGANETLEELGKRYKLGLVTGGRAWRVKHRLRDYDLEHLFSAVVTREDYENLKPNPECLLIGASRLGLSPEQCAYVADLGGDMKAAKSAHMLAIGVTWGCHPETRLEQAGADHVVHDFEELEELLLSSTHSFL
jgi:phosphoglycolate phosphatase